jgi:ABC-type multidrug transport system fused ATPase/permease subunit
MFQNISSILKSIGRKWFIIFIIIILFIFLINPEFAIWMIIITIILYLASFIPNLFFSNRFTRYIKKFHSVEDKDLVKKFNKPLRKIQETLFELSQNLQSYGIKTRAEIKAITDILIKYDRLEEREVSVKTYRDEQRFKESD